MSVTYNTLISPFPNLSPGYILGFRGDTAEVDLFDNLRQGTLSYCQYTTPVVQLPDERSFRLLRLIQKGEGTITGGSIVFYFDGNRTETYTATGAWTDTTQDILFRQDCLGTETAREAYAVITLSGTNLVFRESLFDLVQTE